MRHTIPYSDIFRTLCNPCIYNHAIFRTLTHLEPAASSKACQKCKMIRYIQSPSIARTLFKLFQRYLGIFRDIAAHSYTLRHATRRRGELLCPFLNFFVLSIFKRKKTKMFPCKTFFLCFLMKYLSQCPSPMKP